MAEVKSALRKMEKAVEVEGYGKKSRTEAVANALGKLKNESYKAIDGTGTLVDVHATDVYILAEEEKTKVEKFLGFFAPKQIKNYYIKLKVILEIKYI